MEKYGHFINKEKSIVQFFYKGASLSLVYSDFENMKELVDKYYVETTVEEVIDQMEKWLPPLRDFHIANTKNGKRFDTLEMAENAWGKEKGEKLMYAWIMNVIFLMKKKAIPNYEMNGYNFVYVWQMKKK